MNKCIALFMFWMFVTSCSSRFNCIDSIRTGKFISTQDGIENRIIRTEQKQIEFFNSGKSQIITKIDWVTEDSYILTIEDCINCPGTNASLIGGKMYFSIVECDSNFFTVKTTIDQEDVFIKYHIL